MFPLGVGCAAESQEYEYTIAVMLICLPSPSRAWSLLDAYMANAAWAFQPIKREHIIEDLLTPIYAAKKHYEDSQGLYTIASLQTQISPQKLAVLFLILAIGANLDFALPPNNKEADNYYHYARAALTHGSVLNSPLMETVQAVLLMAHYRGTSGGKNSRDSSWALIGLACKLAQSVRPFFFLFHLDVS